MKIFDAHMHFSNVQAFYGAADESGVDYSYEGYIKEREAAGIVGSICMGLTESSRFAFPDNKAQTPMSAD
ncbi:MAG: amidohydrolase, partial [Defluviitaleaceae bacterium]|nr:amidohydrolase [Defluviitaleaceae bacterium]